MHMEEYQDFTGVETDGAVPGGQVRSTYEIWQAADGSGRIRTEGRTYGEDAGGAGPADIDQTFGPGELGGGGTNAAPTYADMMALPTDVDELYAHIERVVVAMDNGRPVPVEMFVQVADLLGTTPAPPALRGALYQVAARIPGVELVGELTDDLGRAGTAVTLVDENGTRDELLFDPATATPLGTRRVVADRSRRTYDLDPGTVLYAQSYTAAGIVAGTDAVLP